MFPLLSGVYTTLGVLSLAEGIVHRGRHGPPGFNLPVGGLWHGGPKLQKPLLVCVPQGSLCPEITQASECELCSALLTPNISSWMCSQISLLISIQYQAFDFQ